MPMRKADDRTGLDGRSGQRARGGGDAIRLDAQGGDAVAACAVNVFFAVTVP